MWWFPGRERFRTCRSLADAVRYGSSFVTRPKPISSKPGRIGIKCARMTRPLLLEGPPTLRHDIMTGPTGRLVDDEQPVDARVFCLASHSLRPNGQPEEGFGPSPSLRCHAGFRRKPGGESMATTAEGDSDRPDVDLRQAAQRNPDTVGRFFAHAGHFGFGRRADPVDETFSLLVRDAELREVLLRNERRNEPAGFDRARPDRAPSPPIVSTRIDAPPTTPG